MVVENNKNQYLSLLSEIIAKEAVILGPEIAILKARRESGLVIDNYGNVSEIIGFEADAAKELINEYIKLAGQSTKNIINEIFEKYPQVKKIDY
jgi:hypothetical protein